MRLRYVLFLALLTSITLSLSSCLVETSDIGGAGGTKTVVDPNGNPNENATRLICDPFSSNSQIGRERGLFGNIYHIPDKSICSQSKGEDGGACFKNVEDYINKGTLANAYIYLDRLFVQSQPFTKGLVDSNGNAIDLQGVNFYENFAVDVNAQLQLAENEAPGYYQLALISDDGALLKQVNSDGTEVILVNNNGSHPTKMACADTPIWMDHNPVNIKLQQFQGSRKAITMVAMWRPWDPNNKDATSECGKGGNGKYFDSSKTPIQPKKHFYELLVNGWKVLENENFVFPGQEENPCAPQEETLLLTAFSIQVPNRNSVSGQWNSNIPASSQLEVKNTATGAITLSPVDPSLALNHDMLYQGLSPNTLYSVRAISSTPGGQTVKTDERAFRTPR